MRHGNKAVGGIAEDSRQRNVVYTQLDSADEDEATAGGASGGSRVLTFTVEDAVEKLGFGRFQMRILLASGIMTAADAMEMMLLSVLGPALRCEWHLTSSQVATMTTVVFLGMLAGAPCWGAVSDRRGRWSVFALSISLISYFGLLGSFSPSYRWLVFLRGLVGFSISGAASSFTLISEYLPQKYRAKVLIACGVFWGIGSTFEVLLAYAVLPRLGWRYLTAFSSLPLIASLPALLYLPESARYLLACGQTEKAAELVDEIARENGQPLMKGVLAAATVTEAPRGQFSSLFRQPYTRTTLILFCLWFGIAFSYYGVVIVSAEVSHLRRDCPLSRLGGRNDTGGDDTSCCSGLRPEDYKAMVVSSLGEFLIIPFVMLTVDSLGRKLSMSINYMIMGVFFGLIYFCVSEGVTSLFLLVVRAHSGGLFKLVYIYTTEVYPTVIRSTSFGVCSSMARIGSMTAPFVAQVVLPDVSAGLGFAIFALAGIGCAGLSLLLPVETKGRALPQTLSFSDGLAGDADSHLVDNSSEAVEFRGQGKVE